MEETNVTMTAEEMPCFLVFHHIPIEICGSGDNRFPFTSSDYRCV